MKFIKIFTLAMLGLISSISHATLVYGNIQTPGVYFGNGNSNGDWWINTSNGVEVALRVKNRATLATTDGADGVYETTQGLCNYPGGCTGDNKAMWNYEFSVNTHANDGQTTGTKDLTQYFITMSLDQNPGTGVAYTVLNLSGNWGDNYYWDGTAPYRTGFSPIPTEFGVQQSANPMFANSGFGYLPEAGLYDLKLSVKDLQGSLVSEVTTQVQVVPEPNSIPLLLSGLMGVGFVSRKKKNLS